MNRSGTDGNGTRAHFEQCPLCRDIINPYIIPLVIIAGIIGNALCIVVVLSTKLRKYSSNGYLVALFVSDSITLINHLLVKNNLCHSHGLCQLCIFTQYFTTFFSVWILTAFTTERFLVVAYPWQQVIYIKSWRTTKKIILLITFLAFLFSCPWLYIAMFQNNVCGHRDDTNVIKFFLNILVYVESIVTFYIPTVIICILNFKIAQTITKANKRLSSTSRITYTKSVTATAARSLNDDTGAGTSNNPDDVERLASFNRPKNIIVYHSSVKDQNGINITLMVLSVTFIVCNGPFYIVLTILKIMSSRDDQYIQRHETLIIRIVSCKAILEYFYLLNFCLNFLLYSISSRHFRQCFKNLLVSVIRKCFEWRKL